MMKRAWVLVLLALAAPTFAEVPRVFQGKNLLAGGALRIETAAARKATVVAFVSSKCPCSSSHEVTLRELARQYVPQGFQFVAVHSNQDEPAATAQAHFQASAMGIPVLQDDGAQVADQLGALKTPHVYVISPAGELLYQGGVDDSHHAAGAKKHYLAEALGAIAQGRAPELAQSRTLGCVITR